MVFPPFASFFHWYAGSMGDYLDHFKSKHVKELREFLAKKVSYGAWTHLGSSKNMPECFLQKDVLTGDSW